jgi:hypothetical protein
MRKFLRLVVTAALLAGVGVVAQSAPADASHQASTTTVRYGPFTIPAASGGQPGMLENQLQLWTSKPCTNCYITKMAPTLVYTDGSTANVNTGAMLHHIVLASQFRSDPTCSGDWLGLVGERFFASGNERTVIEFPSGYGYRVNFWDQWNLIYDLMNMTPQAKTVYVEIEFTHRGSGVEPVRPVWFDIDQCGDSEYSIPAGFSDSHWDWNVNVPGRIVAIGGHIHDEGVRIEATNQSTGQSICNSVAGYGETPEYIDMMGRARLSSMSRCIADPVATVSRGQTVRVHSVYNATQPHDDVMGIMIGYIDT